MARISAVFYDHDGTLVDSIPAVIEATNAALRAYGFAECDRGAVLRGMLLPTTPRMGSHAGTADFGLQEKLAQSFYEYLHALPHLCRLYDGINGLLAEVRELQIHQAVISNNSGSFVRSATGVLGISEHLVLAWGEEDMPAPKPDPRGLLAAAKSCGVEPGQCLFVGDSPADQAVGLAAGMTTVGVTWGTHSRGGMEAMGFDYLVDQPHELLALIG